MFRRKLAQPELSPELRLQIEVSKMLSLGFVLSITSIFGVGSLYAVVLGVKASRIIRQSNGAISGGLMAAWCIVAGGIGTLIFLPLTVMLLIRQLR